MTTTLRRWTSRVLDAVLPPRCLGCGGLVDGAGMLCPACWGAMTFIGQPLCACCGHPFAIEVGAGMVCATCLSRPPPFRRARAVLRYDDASKVLVLRFKHADRTDAAPAYARWMARAGAELLADADIIAPVPLHWLRLFSRRYNQAALLARELARLSGTPMVADLLQRHRRTPSQGRMGRVERAANLRGAIRARRPDAIAGRRVLLVDDVLTTGATAAECARVLAEHGAAAVDVLTLARVVLGAG